MQPSYVEYTATNEGQDKRNLGSFCCFSCSPNHIVHSPSPPPLSWDVRSQLLSLSLSCTIIISVGCIQVILCYYLSLLFWSLWTPPLLVSTSCILYLFTFEPFHIWVYIEQAKLPEPSCNQLSIPLSSSPPHRLLSLSTAVLLLLEGG